MPLLLISCLAYLPGCESVSSSNRRDEALPLPTSAKPHKPTKASHIVVEKGKRTLTAYAGKQVIATFTVALGRNPVGAKTCSGDYRTPEGHYRITARNPESKYYQSLKLSYPNPADIARARKQGCNPGGNVAIHGLENGFGYVGHTHRSVDWTNGCIAVTNQEMDQILRLAPPGTPVEIRP